MITFSDAARNYIKNKLQAEQAKGFRLSIKKTGCSGYSYVPSLIAEINANDLHFEVDQDLQVYIDAAWAERLKDIYVDYMEETKSGLKQKRLIFTNPNEAGRCGCGESFHIE